MVKIIHVADIHFGCRNYESIDLNGPIVENIMISFRKAINIAIEKNVDLFVISGDFFDGTPLELKIELFLVEMFSLLKRADIKIAYCLGNHDNLEFFNGLEIFTDTSLFLFENHMPKKIDLKSKENDRYSIIGTGFETSEELRNIISSFPVNIHDEKIIGITHGSIESSFKEDHAYAPSTVRDLANKNYDLWCLGHIHKPGRVNDNINAFYSGSIQGINKKETGARGCYYYEINDYTTEAEFIPLSEMIWEKIDIEIYDSEKIWNVRDLLETIENNYARVLKNYEILLNSDNVMVIPCINIQGQSNIFYKINDKRNLESLKNEVSDDCDVIHLEMSIEELLPAIDMGTIKQSNTFVGFMLNKLDRDDYMDEFIKTMTNEKLVGFNGTDAEKIDYIRNILKTADAEILKRIVRAES